MEGEGHVLELGVRYLLGASMRIGAVMPRYNRENLDVLGER